MSSSNQSSRGQDVDTNNRDEENYVHRALWEACAGKLFYVPKEGDQVVYFVQPHIDEVRSYAEPDDLVDVPPNLPAAIYCTVTHVQLLAEPETDEVVAHVMLVPQQEGDEASSKKPEQRNLFDETNSQVLLFTKSLKTSDMSMHGGYTIPKPQALALLPHLDATLGRVAQIVSMCDMHGKEWVLRHTLRGSPRRHLFSTGWSNFLYAKQLIKGDTLVYLRDEDKKYRIGVRRSRKSKLRAAPMATIVSGQSLQFGVLASVVHALQTKSMFSVYCRPWRSRSSFLVPLQEYLDSFRYDYSEGKRFRISFENDECVERRFTGRIDGTEDLDPVRWPGSKWKCLKVTMDYDPTNIDCPIPDRVSPWEIELLSSGKRKDQVPAPFDRKKLFRSNLGFQGSSSSACTDIGWTPEYRGESSSQGFRSGDYEPKFKNPQISKSFTLFGKNIVGIPSEDLPSQANTNQSSNRQQEQPSDKGCHVQVIKYNTATLDTRSIDLSRMSGYNDLIRELDAMFGFSVSLISDNSGWYMTYVDPSGISVRVGDCSWNEFVSVVKRIDIRAKKRIHGGIRIA